MGTLRNKNDGMSELAIIGIEPVVKLINRIHPYLKIKLNTANLILEIVDKLSKVNNDADFIEVCKIVDKVAEFTDSKRRKNTSEVVLKTIK